MNKQPTLQKVHAAVRTDPDLPNLSISSIRRILCELGFVYSSRKRNSILLERPEIVQWRHQYLRKIKKHRKDGRSLIYTDETWVNAGHVKSKTWQDTSILTSKQAFINGLSTGLKNPSGKGERLIVTHAGGGKDGFINEAELIFKAKKQGDGDYHHEMNAKTYEKWFSTQLLPHIPDNSIIILDNASYHSAKKELIPRRGWRKKDIQLWLDKKGILWRKDMNIAELLELIKPLRAQYDQRKIDEMAKAAGHKVLRTPPYHCELNPIELVWGKAKGHVAGNNTSFKLDDVKKLMTEGLANVTPENWAAYENHIIKIENEMWEKEELVDLAQEALTPIIIQPYEDRAEESDSDSDDEDEDEF
ncbi:uncharacterized protein [Amphiura filiformis]|uniref:uncharacterized protein n=1 Tax=Amphiura filiformis TaxID=82378 RepID=UPI003B224687